MPTTTGGMTTWQVIAGPTFGAMVGFLLGLVAFAINEYTKVRRERHALAALFADHLADVWGEVDALKAAPVGPYFARAKASALGVEDLAFSGEPEYQFEVDDLQLFETHGVKLASLLSRRSREQFWLCYRLLRKAEAARRAIQPLPADAKDRSEYQKLFRQLVDAYGREILKLHRLLLREKGWWRVIGYSAA